MFASEYGWPAEYIMALAPDKIAQLQHAILYRKGVEVTLSSGGTSAPRMSLRAAMNEALTPRTE